MQSIRMAKHNRRLKIGISACFFHPDESRSTFKGKTLQYIEQSVTGWIMSQGDMAVMIPSPNSSALKADVEFEDYAEWLDGLVLMGGSDVWPGSYGEQAIQPEWEGDRIRDEYDKLLIEMFFKLGKPILGICRGMQIINVAFGGTLFQDIQSQIPKSSKHRDSESYDLNFHEIQIKAESHLSRILKGTIQTKVNSIHHQCVKDLATNFEVEAFSSEDKIPEAIRRKRRDGESYVAAIQWHPEFHHPRLGTLNDAPILKDFLDSARASKR